MLICMLFFSLSMQFDLSKAQEKKHEWFAEQCLFPLLEYDLLEVQPYAGIFFMQSTKEVNNAAYIPVNLGFRKSFLQWQMLSAQFDLALGAASYTQFEIIRFDQNTLRGGLLNTDFKASGYLNISKGDNRFRIQLFHISSHPGDDYILRNQNYEPNDKSVNYEQVDLLYLRKWDNLDIYGGIGLVITPNNFRERLMIEIGLQGSKSLTPKLLLAYGSDIKIYQENDYRPDVHAGLGICFAKKNKPQLTLLIDSFFGSMPYSTLDLGSIFWLGPSCRLYLN